MAETTKQRSARLHARTAAALIDEDRTALRARAEERAWALEKASPACTNTWTDDKKARSCSHKLNVHDPCSRCACLGFKGEHGESAEVASAELMENHPELFPKPRSATPPAGGDTKPN